METFQYFVPTAEAYVWSQIFRCLEDGNVTSANRIKDCVAVNGYQQTAIILSAAEREVREEYDY